MFNFMNDNQLQDIRSDLRNIQSELSDIGRYLRQIRDEARAPRELREDQAILDMVTQKVSKEVFGPREGANPQHQEDAQRPE
jgi:hypothetical protein